MEEIKILKKVKKNLKAEKKSVVGELKRNYGGSMGGGMTPTGFSPDPTVQSVVGYNPNRPMRGGGVAKRGMGIAKAKGGSIRRRGGGIAKRGMGIAK